MTQAVTYRNVAKTIAKGQSAQHDASSARRFGAQILATCLRRDDASAKGYLRQEGEGKAHVGGWCAVIEFERENSKCTVPRNKTGNNQQTQQHTSLSPRSSRLSIAATSTYPRLAARKAGVTPCWSLRTARLTPSGA